MISQSRYEEVGKERDRAITLATKSLAKHLHTLTVLSATRKELETVQERLDSARLEIELLKDVILELREELERKS